MYVSLHRNRLPGRQQARRTRWSVCVDGRACGGWSSGRFGPFGEGAGVAASDKALPVQPLDLQQTVPRLAAGFSSPHDSSEQKTVVPIWLPAREGAKGNIGKPPSPQRFATAGGLVKQGSGVFNACVWKTKVPGDQTFGC